MVLKRLAQKPGVGGWEYLSSVLNRQPYTSGVRVMSSNKKDANVAKWRTPAGAQRLGPRRYDTSREQPRKARFVPALPQSPTTRRAASRKKECAAKSDKFKLGLVRRWAQIDAEGEEDGIREIRSRAVTVNIWSRRAAQ